MQSRIALRSFLIVALLVVLLPIVIASGWLHYRSAQRAMEEFAEQLADEVSVRVREKVVSFFDVPQRVVTFNVERARAGFLRHEDPDALMRQFLLQIGQQPQLTFVSMGFTNGEYVAGSRPPLGEDRDLRVLRARVADGRAMEVFRVDRDGRPAERISRSDVHFDARTRPWYKAAIARGDVSWYEPYRYLIQDVQGAYATIGMGVSAPVKDRDGTLLGVVTADVALSQIDEFLTAVAKESGGVAFVADAQGTLLAASGGGPGWRRDGERVDERRRIAESGNPILRAVGAAMLRSAPAGGNTFLDIEGERHLARWWTHPLRNGPTLTMGVVLPESRFDTPMRGVLRNIVYLSLAVMMASILLSVHVASRVVRPLAALNDWADRLARGDWQAQAPGSSPIRELRVLADAMDYMAGHLKQHAQQLEQVVAQRTAALQQALASVEQTLKDQRHFIDMLSHEVRSPLAVIHSAAQLLASRSKDAPAQLAIVQRVLRGSTRLNYFFDTCLTQDRMDSENFVLEPAPIDVSAMVAWVLDDAAQLAGRHPLEWSVAADLPTLHGDQVLLRIMLMNLLSNAFKYSPAGAPVDLRVWREGERCCFAVADRGMGIAPEEAAAVFEKYRRGRAAEGKPGAGLGLALVRRIASLHGGTVTLEARHDGGSRFTVAIPFVPPAKA